MSQNALNDTTRYAFEAYSFLIPQKRSVTAKEFALIISRHYDENQPQNREVINELNKLSGMFHRTWQGTTYKPLSPANKHEIVVRDAGWKVVDSNDEKRPGYQVVSKDVEADDFERSTMAFPAQNKRLSHVYRSKEYAWEGACEELKIEVPNTVPVYSKKTLAAFDVMKVHVESPGSLLKAFKEDFYKHDLRNLHDTGATGEYLLIVRESGTEFGPLHYHPRTEGRLLASLQSKAGTEHQYYHLDADKLKVRPLSKSQALECLNNFQYSVANDKGVLRNKQKIAVLDVKNAPAGSEPASCVVHFDTPRGAKFSLRDLVAFREIAIGETVCKTGTLFAKVNAVTVGEERVDLIDLIDRAREAEHAAYEKSLKVTTVQYGRIYAEERDEKMLAHIGIVTGKYHHEGGGFFTVKVTDAAKAELEKQYAGAFKVHLYPDTPNQQIRDLRDDQLDARRAKLAFRHDEAIADGEYGDPEVLSAIEKKLQEIAVEPQRRAELARSNEVGANLDLSI